ncbi:hypothetical protein [Pseudomonas sp. PA15(2017)]|uniref:hypothetical protein n=1 Tax=Pseudomonas sp. PA15(2017) TaxID=1932111 RepID=UPI0035324653
MAIIAVETDSDTGLVPAMQTPRPFGVVLTGALFARQVIRLTIPAVTRPEERDNPAWQARLITWLDLALRSLA